MAGQLEKLREIVERIMTQHWDLARCQCWICREGRRAGCSSKYKYADQDREEYPPVKVVDERQERLRRCYR